MHVLKVGVPVVEYKPSLLREKLWVCEFLLLIVGHGTRGGIYGKIIY